MKLFRSCQKYASDAVCSIPGCTRRPCARGWCNGHYQRFLATGNPVRVAEADTHSIPSQLELAWAAGLFEGEGSVRISKPALRNWGAVTASVVNTDKQIIDWFQTRWPGYCKPATGLRRDQKPAWVWVIAATKAIRFLREIEPFIVRDKVREKITHACWFQSQKRTDTRTISEEEKEEYRADQWNAYWWMAHLNTRGTGVPNAKAHRKPK